MVLSHALIGAVAGSGDAGDTGSWVAIQSNTLGSDTASVTMSSSGSSTAWSDFQDLVLVMAGRGTNNGVGVGVTTEINSDSGDNYLWQNFNTNGGTVGAAKTGPIGYFRTAHLIGADMSANFYGVSIINFMDVNATDKYKTIYIQEGFGTMHASEDNSLVCRMVSWQSTSAMTTFTMNPDGNFASGSQFDLYGIRTSTG